MAASAANLISSDLRKLDVAPTLACSAYFPFLIRYLEKTYFRLHSDYIQITLLLEGIGMIWI
jgi:hypothetical protein